MFRKIAIMCMAVLWKETRTQVSILVVSRSTCGSSGHMCAVVGVGGGRLMLPPHPRPYCWGLQGWGFSFILEIIRNDPVFCNSCLRIWGNFHV